MFGNSEYDDKCGSCKYYNYEGRCSQGRCDYFLDLHYPDEQKCYNYWRKRRDAYVNDYEDEDDNCYMKTLENAKVNLIQCVSTLKTLRELNKSITQNQQTSNAKVYKIGEMPTI